MADAVNKAGDDAYWRFVVSKHYDHTGDRITKEQAQKLYPRD
jgi:hypothetical protein